MLLMESSTTQDCPLCSSSIEEYYVDMETKFTMCDNIKCVYPFNTAHPEPFLAKVPHLLNKQSEDTQLTGKKHARQLDDEAVGSGNGKKQKIESAFLTSPIKQTNNFFNLVLPSKPTSSGILQLESSLSIDAPDMKALLRRHQSSPAMEMVYMKKFDSILQELEQLNLQANAKYHYSLNDLERFLQDDTGELSPLPILVGATTTLVESTNIMAWLEEIGKELCGSTGAGCDVELTTNGDNSMSDLSFDLVNPMTWLGNLFQECLKQSYEQDFDVDVTSDHGSMVVTPKDEPLNDMVWLDDLFKDQVGNPIAIKYHPLQSNQDLDSIFGLSFE